MTRPRRPPPTRHRALRPRRCRSSRKRPPRRRPRARRRRRKIWRRCLGRSRRSRRCLPPLLLVGFPAPNSLAFPRQSLPPPLTSHLPSTSISLHLSPPSTSISLHLPPPIHLHLIRSPTHLVTVRDGRAARSLLHAVTAALPAATASLRPLPLSRRRPVHPEFRHSSHRPRAASRTVPVATLRHCPDDAPNDAAASCPLRAARQLLQFSYRRLCQPTAAACPADASPAAAFGTARRAARRAASGHLPVAPIRHRPLI